jgi:HAE1 family hydrophobic/amphiphilic exporter-1
MFLAKLSINRPVMMTMFILVFIVFGILAYLGLSLNLMPDIDIPFVTIQTLYPGAGPQEIETQISRRIEDAVATVSQVDFIQSYSMDNVSFVLLRFDMGKEIEVALREVKEKVDAILNDLPRDAERPLVSSWDFAAMPVVDLVFSGNFSPIELYDYADMRLRDRFSQIEGVARVEMSGGQKREIQVLLDRKTVEQYGISLPQLTGIIAAHNLDMPGGQFQQSGQELSVRLAGQISDLNTLENLEIPTIHGVRRLREIAEVRDTGTEIREMTTFFDRATGQREENIIRFGLVPSPEGNPVDISRAVRKELGPIRAELPEGLNIRVINDSSVFIESTVNDTLMNILLGILFTGLILFVFLNDLRSTLIVALAMPTSIVSTFLLMQMFGFTLNMMTLMGFSTAVGILVTNSVIVLENIFRHKNMGHTRKEAAGVGTSEIAVAVIASTLTNIVVFLPIATMTSLAGQFFREFALVVAFATIFSLLISFTVTPLLASRILPEKQKPNRFNEKFDRLFRKLERLYQRTLGFILKNKKTAGALVGSVFILFILSFFVGAQVGFEFMPFLDEGTLSLELELPEGYDLSETAKIVEEIESIIIRRPEVESILTTIGSMGMLNVGPNVAGANIQLIDAADRDLSSHEVADLFMSELAMIPNATVRLEVQSGFGGGGDAPVSLFVMGQDKEIVEDLALEIMDKIAQVPGLTNLDSSLRPGRPELTYRPKYDRMAAAGVTVQDLAMTLRSSVEGLVATQYREIDREYDLKVLLERPSIDSPSKIADIPVITKQGTFTFSQLADLEFAAGTSMLMRKDKFSAVEITGGLAAGYPLGNVVGGIRQILSRDIELPSGYRIDWGGDSQMLDETVTDMLRTFFIAILLTYMLLAAVLESFVQPIYILATLPLALIGIFLALFITGQTMNIVSMMAIIMLIGIVVNNAILLLDYTNQLVKEGKNPKEALLSACPTKLKPIVMATLAIILGMLPMAIGVGSAGKELRQPMGIVSIGGLIVSALLTLFIIPSVYYVFRRRKKRA